MSTGFENGSDDFDAFTFEDVDPDRPGSGGGGFLPEGGYKFVVTEVTVKNERGSTRIECEVVAAKDPALVGRKHVEYLNWPDGQHSPEYNRIKKEQLLAWCYAGKTTNPKEVAEYKQARKGFEPRWLEGIVGRPVLAYVKLEKYTAASGEGKTSCKCEGRVWAMDNPKGKGIPGWSGDDRPAAGPSNPVPTTPTEPANQFDGLV